MTGTPSRTARASTARWGLKAAAGKTLTRGTQIVYEAIVCGRGSVGIRSPKSSGTGGRKHGGHGVKVTRLTLGDLCTCYVLSASKGGVMGVQESAEGKVDRCSGRRPEQANPIRYRSLDGKIRRRK